MTKLQKGLSQVDNKVSTLKKTFEQRTTEAAKLKVELEKEQETIEAAENLVGKLEGEYQRWSEQVHFAVLYCCHDFDGIRFMYVFDTGSFYVTIWHQ